PVGADFEGRGLLPSSDRWPEPGPTLLRGFAARRLGMAVAVALVEGLQAGEPRHRDDVVARIDEMDLAGHRGGEVGEQVQRRVADLLERDGAAERRVLLLVVEHDP